MISIPRLLDLRTGYYRLYVYVDGVRVHSFDDHYGDIYAALKALTHTDETDFLDELIEKVQKSLEESGKRKLSEKEIEILKSKMLDTDNIPEE